ncbi:MAG: acetylornithine/N-succinyldiaminopimelate aminotransferase, partial [Myxococcota bacterium]
YLDFVQGWAVNCLGHAPKLIQDALAVQAATLINPSPAYHNRVQLDFAALLCKKSGLDRVFFCNSGAEANEGAIKLARKWGKTAKGGAHEIITFTGAFHGRTLATMAASDKPGWDTLFAPSMDGFRRLPFGDIDAVANAIGEQTVAIMLEPIQGEAGVVAPPRGFLKALRDVASANNVLLILDEIQTGMGRTGPLFAHQHEELLPDIMTLGKGIGGGVPLAALLAQESISCFESGDQGGTYNGNPLMAAVGLAVLEQLCDPAFVAATASSARRLWEGLNGLASTTPGTDVRGSGHLIAMTLPKPVAVEIVAQCQGAGLLINAPRPDVLRFMPALNTKDEEIDAMLSILSPIVFAALAEA